MKNVRHTFSLGKSLGRSLGTTPALLCSLGLFSASAAPSPAPEIPGYRAIPADVSGINRMAVTVYVNGHGENFIVDTGASRTMLAFAKADLDGVKLTDDDSRYGQYSHFKGEILRIGLVDDLHVGRMDFGPAPILLFDSTRNNLSAGNRSRSENYTGFLGADILLRCKAVIDTRIRHIFFQTDSRRAAKLAAVLGQTGFTRIPLIEDECHTVMVDCTLDGKPGRLLIDTGAVNTHINAATARDVHLSASPSNVSFSDVTGERHPADIARVKSLRLGNFLVAEQQIFVVSDPFETAGSAETKFFGLLGNDVLARLHGIIDLGSMSLFVK